jgi:hypothetical protein
VTHPNRTPPTSQWKPRTRRGRLRSRRRAAVLWWYGRGAWWRRFEAYRTSFGNEFFVFADALALGRAKTGWSLLLDAALFVFAIAYLLLG